MEPRNKTPSLMRRSDVRSTGEEQQQRDINRRSSPGAATQAVRGEAVGPAVLSARVEASRAAHKQRDREWAVGARSIGSVWAKSSREPPEIGTCRASKRQQHRRAAGGIERQQTRAGCCGTSAQVCALLATAVGGQRQPARQVRPSSVAEALGARDPVALARPRCFCGQSARGLQCTKLVSRQLCSACAEADRWKRQQARALACVLWANAQLQQQLRAALRARELR